MKTLIIFPVLILLLCSLFSLTANYTYSTAPPDAGTLTNGTITYGTGYQILPNGTYVFTNPSTIILSFHDVWDTNKVVYSIIWNTISNITEHGLITFNNGTAPLNVGYSWGFNTQEYKYWSQVVRLDGKSFNTYLSELAVKENNLVVLTGSSTLPITALQGGLLIITVIMMIASVVGIKVFGSGLDTFTVEVITKGSFFLGFFGILSVLAYPIIANLYLLGSFFYLVLTVMYIYGFVSDLRSGGEN